jgi:predicted nucleic acid-binding protein
LNAIFLDTVGLIALWDESDQWHDGAQAAFDQLAATPRILLTSTYVLLETGNAAARRSYRNAVVTIRYQLQNAGLLIDPSSEDVAQAWTRFERGDADQAGIVDHVSFTVMRRLGITEAFTNDHHFRAAGFVTLF